MLGTQDNLRILKELARREPNIEFWSYVSNNPQVLMATGFDEVRIRPSELAQELRRVKHRNREISFSGTESLAPLHPTKILQRAFIEREEEEDRFADFILGLNCRESSSGAWFHVDPEVKFQLWLPRERITSDADEREILAHLRRRIMSLPRLPLTTGNSEVALTPLQICVAYAKAVESQDLTAALVLPGMWIPPEKHPTIAVVEAAKDLLRAVRNEERSLQDLGWQDLEAIVAELLRGKGMEVRVTPRSRDGGRDVIARGELIPGEPAILAVEVKHKAVVNLDEVRSRLYANRDFPALLFATSGRFTAGVVREKQKPGNHLRLFLKDGVGLEQWIASYVAT